jgi:hypothetical protein
MRDLSFLNSNGQMMKWFLCLMLCVVSLAACETTEENIAEESDSTSGGTSDTSDTSGTGTTQTGADIPMECDAIALACYACNGTDDIKYGGCGPDSCPLGYSTTCEFEEYPACGEEIEAVCCVNGEASAPRCQGQSYPFCPDGATLTDTEALCTGGTQTPACPEGPESPLGEACDSATFLDQQCRYGYDPIECGGRTVQCEADVWVEVEHTDPQESCALLP